MNARNGNQPIPGLYGIGQGYSLSTSDNSVQAELRPGGKADSVGLYIKQIGNKILSQLLPTKKIRYLMPPTEAQMGLSIMGQKTGSLLDQLSSNKQQSISQPAATQANTSVVLSNHNGPLVQSSGLVGGGAGNPQVGQCIDSVSNSRAMTSNSYHPKTQEHRSEKFQSFQYSGKIIGNTSNLSGINQPNHFGSVFTKTVGSSHNVLGHIQKSSNAIGVL